VFGGGFVGVLDSCNNVQGSPNAGLMRFVLVLVQSLRGISGDTPWAALRDIVGDTYFCSLNTGAYVSAKFDQYGGSLQILEIARWLNNSIVIFESFASAAGPLGS
jgi:hypothetical protein